MGRVMVNGLTVMATAQSPNLDQQFRKDLDDMVQLADNSDISLHERKHARAMKLCGDG